MAHLINLYIADRSVGGQKRRIRRVDTGADNEITGAPDEIITSVAGAAGFQGFNGDNILASSARLALPLDVALDAAGNLYIADGLNRRVRRVDAGADGLVTRAGDETITTVAGRAGGFRLDGVLATDSALQLPVAALAFDAAGNLCIATGGAFFGRVRCVEAVGPPVVTNQAPVADAGGPYTVEAI